MGFPITYRGCVPWETDLDFDQAKAVFVEEAATELRRLKVPHVEVEGGKVSFRARPGGSFWNIFAPASRGYLEVVQAGHYPAISYYADFTGSLIYGTVAAIVCEGFVSSMQMLQYWFVENTVQAIIGLGLFWILFAGGMSLFEAVKIPDLIRVILQETTLGRADAGPQEVDG